MKIWLIQANEPMPIVYPGARLMRMGLLANELRARNHDITWFATTFNHYGKNQKFDKDTIVKIDNNYRLNLIWAPSYKRNISVNRIINHKYMALRFRKIASALDKPDLIYVSFPTIDFAQEAIDFGEKNKIKVVVDVRDLWPDIFNFNLPKGMAFLAKPYISLLNTKTKRIMRKAYSLTAISPGVLEWAKNKGNRKETFNDKSFYMGYNNDEKGLEQVDILNIKRDDFVIIYCGAITRSLNYDYLINLAKRCMVNSHIKFLICGDGPFLEKFKHSVLKAKLNNVVMPGWVNKKQINYLMSKSKIGIIPYNNTQDFQISVSNKFIEYLCYGLPMLIGIDGYMKDIAQKNNCGYATLSIEKAYDYIEKLKTDQIKYNDMSNRCLKLYEDKFNSDKVYKDLSNYLESIITERKLI